MCTEDVLCLKNNSFLVENEYTRIRLHPRVHIQMARILVVVRNLALLAAAAAAIPSLLVLAILFPFLDLCLPREDEDMEEDDDSTVSIDEHEEEISDTDGEDDTDNEKEEATDDEKEEGEISEEEGADDELSEIEHHDDDESELEARDSWIPTGKINILMNATGQTGRTFTMEFDFDNHKGTILDAINTSVELPEHQPVHDVSGVSASSAVEAPTS